MGNDTMAVTQIRFSENRKKILLQEQEKKNLIKNAKKALGDFDELYVAIEELWDINEILTFDGKEYVYYTKFNLFLDSGNAKKIDLVQYCVDDVKEPELQSKNLKGMQLELLTKDEAKSIFFESKSDKVKLKKYPSIFCQKDYNIKEYGYVIASEKKFVSLTRRSREAVDNFGIFDQRIFQIYLDNSMETKSARMPICHHVPKSYSKLEILLQYDICPVEFEEKELFENLKELLKKGYLNLEQGKISITEQGNKAIEDGECKKIGRTVLSAKNLQADISLKNQSIDLNKMSDEEKQDWLDYYLNCDKLRANMSMYDRKRLEDPNLGHWELWEDKDRADGIKLKNGNLLYARNPLSDLQEDSIVGIDFGTTSTVVVFQNASGEIKPMPIGCRDMKKELTGQDFENPTVLQFINLKDFLKKYREKAGRPETLWQDLIASHSAKESMKDNGVKSEEFYSYLYDLKQWAGEGNQVFMLKDKSGTDYVLPSYREMIKKQEEEQQDCFDPIELYAYYIGLYVNNMNNGIFMDYLLSFPVTYEKQIRDSIIDSFQRGLKKSLPDTVQKDDLAMEKFNVVAGASEPAAYAICALEEYGFEPEPGEEYFYGIFDFGGGTCDFDFGVWSASENEDVYDYCIQHFGSEGDRYLGGENLLQLIAFEVFRSNIAICRQENIMFSKPIELKDIPVELKGFVKDSQEAKMNMKLMMEKLRPFWERKDGKDNDDGIDSDFQISLFDANGVLQANLTFHAEKNVLETILKKRIEKGVRQFYHAMKGIFSNEYISKTKQVDKIHIFLAGNSSRSTILQEIFENHVKQWNEEIVKNNNGDEEGERYFEIYPPLGTEKARQIQKQRHVEVKSGLESPTGKTGVAWGLIEAREGSRIEVKEEISAADEAKFAYYLGSIVRKKFQVKVGRNADYHKWIRFIPALQKKIEIAFTALPEATTGNLAASDAGVLRKRVDIPMTGENLFVYIRLTGRNEIEYAVGDDKEQIVEESSQKLYFD